MNRSDAGLNNKSKNFIANELDLQWGDVEVVPDEQNPSINTITRYDLIIFFPSDGM